MSQWFGVFQKFGKALMVPVALLPAAGILLGLGAALTGPLAESWTFLQNGTVETISAGMLQIGLSIFANLLGFFMMLIWPPIQTGLTAMANVIASDATNPAYVGLYGMLERLLIPTGLQILRAGKPIPGIARL
ncbi:MULTISPECIES: hypothetical protein [unclassified Exiguobacterium]|uniref:hypothetical protein n=1 Tax=unclassified Exiguobacterium TaxID=2644629 RepID=UPI001BE9DC31|nr:MULTISPECIES: hypothetical protein [unclassified Exiguobacterium]